jgi:hypothetical protein
VDCYLLLIEPLKHEVKLLSADLKRNAGKDPEVRLLMTIPGVGYYVALLVKAEIGDVHRFARATKGLCRAPGSEHLFFNSPILSSAGYSREQCSNPFSHSSESIKRVKKIN